MKYILKKICLVIGDPVDHSLSPVMHNAGYESCGISSEFIYLAVRVKNMDLKLIPIIMKTLGIRGISVTIPHKSEMLKYLKKNDLDKAALEIGAVNTLVNVDGRILGKNTDYLGILKSLEKLTELSGKKMAIIGSGGVARAASYAGIMKAADIRIFGRTYEKSARIAHEIGGTAKTYDEINQVSEADIIFNATPLGMAPEESISPIPAKYLSRNQIIFDAIYSPAETKLIRDAKKIGAKTLPGLELLLYQGIAQFELFTGVKAPEATLRKVLYSQH